MKAHIIPASFYGKGLLCSVPPLVFTSDGRPPIRSHRSFYDQSIVTKEGEKYFGRGDDYAYKLLAEKKGNFSPFKFGDYISGQKIEHYDYDTLKLFFLSLLWRSSITKLDAFKRIDLGQHEEQVRKMILERNPGDPEQYSVCLCSFVEPIAHQGTMLFPYLQRHESLNFYVFSLRGYAALIKMDSRKTPMPFNFLQLSPDRPLYIVERSIRGTPQMHIINRVMNENRMNLPDWW